MPRKGATGEVARVLEPAEPRASGVSVPAADDDPTGFDAWVSKSVEAVELARNIAFALRARGRTGERR